MCRQGAWLPLRQKPNDSLHHILLLAGDDTEVPTVPLVDGLPEDGGIDAAPERQGMEVIHHADDFILFHRSYAIAAYQIRVYADNCSYGIDASLPSFTLPRLVGG